MLQQQRAIGVLCHEFGKGYYGGIVHGVAEVAAGSGVPVIAIEGSLAELPAPLWAAEHIAGWVVIHPFHSDLAALQRLIAAGKPVVTVGTTLAEAPCSYVHVDHHEGMLLSVEHLIAHGHTRIACVDHGEASWMRRLVDGYKEALAAHGIGFDPALLLTPEQIPIAPDVTSDDIFTRRGELVAQYLLEHDLGCTALVTGPDLTALAAMRVLQAHGRRVPEDLAVVGFDDLPGAQSATPTLSTVRQRFDDLGRVAAKQVLAELGGAPAGPVALPITLLRRGSCGCSSIAALLAEHELEALSGPDWGQHLARLLVQAVRYPLPLGPGEAPEAIWPGIGIIVQALESTVTGRPIDDAQTITAAWRQAVELTDNVEALELCQSLLATAHTRRTAGATDPAASDGLRLLSRELLRARAALSDERQLYIGGLLEANHTLTMRLLAREQSSARQLQWLAHTPATWGCLGLWDEERRQVSLTGVYQRAGAAPATTRVALRPAAFPPRELLEERGLRTREVLLLLPVRDPDHDWGVVALSIPATRQALLQADTLSTQVSLLGATLAREEGLRELRAQQETLQLAYERERILAQTIQELGCPVIPLFEQVLLVPLVGGIDSRRAQQILGTVLEAVSRERARTVLLDVTGVAVVDTQVANALISMARATVLLGAQVVLVGIRPEIAQSIVGLGIDLGRIVTSASLASALRMLRVSKI